MSKRKDQPALWFLFAVDGGLPRRRIGKAITTRKSVAMMLGREFRAGGISYICILALDHAKPGRVLARWSEEMGRYVFEREVHFLRVKMEK